MGTDLERRPATARLERLLWDDLATEYDARFLAPYLRARGLDGNPDFRATLAAWAADEERHHATVRAWYERFFGWTDAQERALAGRRPDFVPLAHLFTDPFAVLCLLAYDELVTVRGYLANLPTYAAADPELGAFVRRLATDEGCHYRAFLGHLRRDHAHRATDAPAVLARVRAAEGTPYAATFVLDHDDPVYEERMYDEAQRVLLRALGTATERASG